MARNIRTKKVNALNSVSSISSGDEFIVSTSEQNVDGTTTTAVKKVAQNVLEAKIVDAAVSAIGDIGGGGGAAVTENTIAVDTFSSNTYARTTNFVLNKNGTVLETEVMNIANPCTVTVCVNIKTEGATNNSTAVLRVKTPNMRDWVVVESIPINISAASSVVYSFSNMKVFSGVSLKVTVFDTGNKMLVSGSSVNLNEFKNDGDFTDHGETFVYLVSKEQYLSDGVIDIPDINGTNNGVIRTRGYVSVIDCWNTNKDNSANYNVANDRSVNFYLQIYDSNSTLWKTLDVVSLYVNLSASSLHIIEFNDVFVPNGAKLRILSSYKYPAVYNIGPYTENNFIIKFESMIDADVNNLPSNLISFDASNAYITTNGIDYDGTYISFNTESGRSPSPIRNITLRNNESAPHNFTSLLPFVSTTDYMSYFSPTFVGIRHITPFNNLNKREAGYFAQINYENSNVTGSTVLWGDQDGELSFTMTNAETGYFYGNYHVVLSNDVKSIGFSCQRAATQDNGSVTKFVDGSSYPTMSATTPEYFYRPYIQNLISVDKFGSKLETLEEFCFTGATNLTNVNFPEDRNIDFKGYYGFYGCKNIAEIMIPDNIKMDSESSSNEGCFAMCDKLQTLGLPRFFSFASKCISGCDSLVNLYMHNLENGRNLPQHAICECPNLAVIDLRKFTTFASSGIVDVGQNTITNDDLLGLYDNSTIIFDYHTIFEAASQSTTADATLTFPANMVYNYVANEEYARMQSIKIYNTVIPDNILGDSGKINTFLRNKIAYSLLERALPAKRIVNTVTSARTYYFYSDEGETEISTIEI